MKIEKNFKKIALISTIVLGLLTPILTSPGAVRAEMSQSISAEVNDEVVKEKTGISIPEELQEVYLAQVQGVSLIKTHSTGFKSRLTAPTPSNAYYFSNNVFYKAGYGMPNCTAYAWGRAYEILGSKPSLSTGNAKEWWGYNAGKYSSGQTPRFGSVVCWGSPEGGGYGHVAVVEEINGDILTISESSWGGFMFRTRKFNKKNMGAGFQGYIYMGDFSTIPVSPPVKLPAKNLAQATSLDINYETHVSEVG
ncbi:MAG: CHAP domain-containing protein [Pseudolactococcus laudensis]